MPATKRSTAIRVPSLLADGTHDPDTHKRVNMSQLKDIDEAVADYDDYASITDKSVKKMLLKVQISGDKVVTKKQLMILRAQRQEGKL